MIIDFRDVSIETLELLLRIKKLEQSMGMIRSSKERGFGADYCIGVADSAMKAKAQ